MNELLQWGGHPVVHRLGWTLLHFLWQGAVVAGLFAVAHISQRKRSSNVRYGTGCVALLLMLAAPVVTFVVMGPEQAMPVALTIQLNPASPTTFSQTRIVLTPDVQHGPAASLPREIPFVAAIAPAVNPEKFILGLVLAWMLGVSTLTLRLLFCSLHVARLKRRGSETLDASWIERLDRLKAVLQISRPVRLVKSALVEVPSVVGWLRPVILLPAATLAGLTPAQLESILAHELAHVRRHDYLVNLLQNALETLLFYHPAVWWVSSCVRAEREICCDEIAIQLCGDRLIYAKALTTLEQLRGGHSSLALGADGGSLLERIRRLSGAPAGGNFPSRSRAGGVLIAALVAIIIVFVLHHPSTNAKARESTASPDLTGTVRGPTNQPISNAAVSIYAATPNVDGVESRSSDDCQKHATTDANGKFVIKALDANAYFRVLIVAKGFRPMFCYGVDPTIKTLDVTLKAISSGALPEEQLRGRVVDPDGKPVSGALVNVYGAHREKEGWREPAWEDIEGPVFTDDAGEFVIHGQSPFISCDLSVEASGFTQSGRYTEVSTGAAVHEFRLTKGVSLKGRLLKDGRPVANAGIGLSVVKTDVIDREFSVATDSEGRFSFVNIPPNREYYLFGIMRSLKERGALAARRVRVEGDGSSLDVGDLNLEPAFTLAGVLRLANGQPAPSTWTMTLCRTVMTPTPAGEPPPIGPGRRDFLGLEYNFDHCWGKIGKNGEFHFSGVPAETVSLMFMVTYPYKISPRNASGDTAGYRLLGRVVTNKTDLVIEFEPNAQPQKSAPLDYQALSQKPLRGVEAGERPPAATNQTNVETSIAPNPSTEWTGTILLPNGQPAAGAQVGFAAANEAIRLKGSRLSRSTGDEAPIASTDAQGRFSLPLMESANSMDSADSLIAAHDGGYFKIEKQDLKVPLLIRLEAWGRIEGTLHVGKRPGANEAILLSMATGSPSSPKLDTSDSWRKTGVGGRFVFEHVPPGKVRLCHMIRFGNGGGNSSGYTLARVKPGNVTKVEMGGDGRQVIGKAVKDSGVAFDWDQAVVQLHGPSPYQPDQPQFFCGPITDDGSFRVDDVPAGSYTLTINVSSHRRDSRVIELGIVPAPLFTKDVKVPEVSDRRSDTPVDLGTLHIGSATNNAPSNPPSAVQPSSRGSSNELSAINQAIVLPKALAAKPNLTNAASGPSSSSKPAINSLGLTLEIRCTTNVLKVGDEIPIEFTISNHGTEDYKYPDRTYDRSGRMPEYELTAKTASGESVPDPRVHFKPFGMGGLFQYGVLHPGESFSKIIALNLWALIKEPGQYEVVGIYARDDYRNDPIVPVKSDPISITVLPRSKEEMNDYIQGLTHQLGAEDSVKKLMYTCSPASISTLLSILCQPNAGNGNERFWATAALEDYMPRTEESRKAILEAATKYRFLNGNGFEQVLMAYDFNNKEMKPIIERALAVDNSGEWGAGVWLALRYYDAAFTLRLIAIAGDPNARGDTRSIAMRVLTSNRTDAGVKAIKALLKDPAQEMLRPLFETIANGYSGQGTATNGRPLQAEDFSAEDLKPLIERLLASTNQALQLQLSGVTLAKQFGSDALTAQLVALSTNPSPYISAGAIYALALNRTDEGVKTLKTLLNDSDPKVSKMAEEAIRNAYISRGDARGRPLRADDFEAKFREPEATPAK